MNCPNWFGYDDKRCHLRPQTLEEAKILHQNGDKLFADPLPDIFVNVEQSETPGIRRNSLAFDLGALGFFSEYGMYLFPEPSAQAWAEAHLDLESYKAFKVPEVIPFSATPLQALAEGAAPVLVGCPQDWNSTEDGGTQMTYALNVLQAKYNYVCRESWWLTPACAALGSDWKTKCIAFFGGSMDSCKRVSPCCFG
jgi:hypothetical protein